MYNIAEKEAAEDASIVFTAITPILKSVPARVEPVLKPNHPKKSTRLPTIAIGIWCPGIALGVPSFLNFPIRGPSTIAPASAETPPTIWTTDDPAKSTTPWPSPKFIPSCDNHPPPQIQFAYNGYVNMDTQKT